MTSYSWQDPIVPTLYPVPNQDPTPPDDFTWVGDKFGGSKFFSIFEGVMLVRQYSPGFNGIINQFGVGLSTFDEEAEIHGEGITNDRKRLIIAIRSPVRGDHWYYNDMGDGRFIQEIFPSDGGANNLSKLVWMQRYLWILFDDDAGWQAKCYDPSTGDLVDSFVLGGADLDYTGITTDGRYLWFIRADALGGLGGCTECWDPIAKVMVRRFAMPNPMTDVYHEGITFADRFFLVYTKSPLPGDGEEG